MPTIVSHVATAIPISLLGLKGKMNKKVLAFSALMALVPDLDGIGYALGVEYASTFGHRGFSHSLIFVILVAWLFCLFLKKQKQISQKTLFLNFFTIGTLHILMDAMTNGGLGVALLAPFSNARFFLPWTPIEVSAILPQYFWKMNGSSVIRFEFLYIVLPSIMISTLLVFQKEISRIFQNNAIKKALEK